MDEQNHDNNVTNMYLYIYKIYNLTKHVAMGFVHEIKYVVSCMLLCKTQTLLYIYYILFI